MTGGAKTRSGSSWVPLLVGTLALMAAFPPVGLWPLVVLAPMALTAAAAQAPSGRAAFWRLSLAGFAFFGVSNAWLAETHLLNWALVSVPASLYYGSFGWLARRALLRGFSPVLVVPLCWTALEMLRLNWFFGGYPWLMVGHAVAASPVLVQAADLGGVMLLSLLVSTLSGGLLARLAGRRGVAVGLAALAFLFVYGWIRPGTLSEPGPGPLLVAIQPGFPQVLKDDPIRGEERMDVCLGLSREVLAAEPEARLLVWPETMWPFYLLDGEGAGPQQAAVSGLVRDMLRAGGDEPAALIGAAVEDRPARTLANSVLYFDNEGRRLGRYDKHVLVPGGEFVPMIDVLPDGLAGWLRDRIVEMAGFLPELVRGKGPALMELDGRPFGVTICYENAYGTYCRQFVGLGAEFLVNVSNEGWFGRSSEFDHMELQSILRAVETRRALFRATNTGISSLVRPDGRAPAGADRLEVDGADRAVRGTFAARVPIHTDTTLYTLWGDWPGWLAGLGAVLLFLWPRNRVS